MANLYDSNAISQINYDDFLGKTRKEKSPQEIGLKNSIFFLVPISDNFYVQVWNLTSNLEAYSNVKSLVKDGSYRLHLSWDTPTEVELTAFVIGEVYRDLVINSS